MAICFANEVTPLVLQRPWTPFLLRRWPLLAAALALFVLLFGNARAAALNVPSLPQDDGQPTIRFVHNPEAAPDFAVQTLDGKPLKLSDTTGKVVLLNFWATWCGPCRMEIPDLIVLQNEYKDSLQIISLLVDVDDVDDAKRFVQSAGINYPVALATTDIRLKYGGVSALPTLFMLDTQGRIVQKHVGLYDPRLYELEARALLNLAIPFKVGTFEDNGEIFLKNAGRATELPGVDLASLSAEQKAAALRALNEEACTCGCKLTLAQCRIYDSACRTSKDRAAKIVTSASAKPDGNASGPLGAAAKTGTPETAPEKSPRQ